LRELVRDEPMRELAISRLPVCGAAGLPRELHRRSTSPESLRYSLVAAGLVLTVANVAGVVGRIAWGGFADFHLASRVLLGWLGVPPAPVRSRPPASPRLADAPRSL
jgi:hypothetical protein